MIIIPAIDIRKRKCVMLTQGKKECETVFSDDPVAMAQTWTDRGAQRLHVVDLDGAFSGKPVNLDLVQEIKERSQLPVQMGGGIRNKAALDRVMSHGIDQAIIGTAAIRDPAFLQWALHAYPGRIIIALDARNGKISVDGWTDRTTVDAVDTARELSRNGEIDVLYTDVEKDGMMQGPNWEGIKKMSAVPGVRVIASGGFSVLKDIQKITRMKLTNITGVIIGKALYTGDIKLEEAIAITKKAYSV